MATRSNPSAAAPASAFSIRAALDGNARHLATEAEGVVVRQARRVRVGSAARAAGAVPAPIDVQPDELVCVEYDNGIRLWTRADDLLRDRGRAVATRGDGGTTWEIETAPRLSPLRGELPAGAERGALGLGIKVLEFFGVDLAGKAARTIGDGFELRQLKLPEGTLPGLFRVSLGDEPTLTRIADGKGAKTVVAGKPVLVFLHGTMSRLTGSFGDLWSKAGDDGAQAAAALREALQRRHGSEVYAFEHRTLTHSPIRNALELARELPVGALLHLVSHSRGGLVGELMCLGERDKSDDPLRADRIDALFAADLTVAEQLGLGRLDGADAKARDAAYAADRALLAELVRTLDEKRIRVQRFVRVACPARGTTLASGRLDRWLSVINFLTGDGLIADSADFLLAVLKERTDPRTLPGVEAMMPGSALIRLLHQPELVTASDLSVISGDVQGKSLWGQFKLLALDWFYASDHDLVVNTGSMYGGIARAGGAARYRRDEGDQVNHFRYFTNRKSVGWLADALARESGSDAGYAALTGAPHEEPRWRSAVRASRAAEAPRPIVVVIPGTMGSTLTVKGRPVWLEYFPLLKGGLGDIGMGASDVAPVDLLDDFYGPLLLHLTRTHRVEIFPYDWRLSVREAAARLADRLEPLLLEAERTRQPLQIVAHSMGGLVARAMIADGAAGTQAWRRLTALPGGRLLMLGTPNLGSHEAVRWLVGLNPTEAKLILLDFTRGTNGIIDVVRQFPGLAELLPFDQERNPWGQVATWRELRTAIDATWNTIEDKVLRQAAATWSLLRAAPADKEHMIYVAGCQPATVIGHEIVQEEFAFVARRKLQFIATSEGDGTVAWSSGRLPDVPMYYAPDTGHDQLCSNTDDRRIFRGYVDLLLTGKTDQLSTAPPGRARAAGAEADRFVLPEQPLVDDLPDEQTLRSSGFGGGRARRRAAGAAPQSAQLQVSVRHGDLRYARHPVLVGHYIGDTIVSAERALDQQMRGALALGPLSRRRDLGLYPGPYGTHAVFFNEQPGRRPRGAVVVGLGQVGELTPQRLEIGVRDALLEYALRLQQRAALEREKSDDPAAAPTRISASVSSLLVGTGASSLPVRESIEATLRGALAANRKLEDAKLDQLVLIEQIEFIELYEDVAIGAAKELGALAGGAALGPRIEWKNPVVVPGEGRRQRSRFEADQSWWQRVEITEDRKGDRLRFVATADRARAEETLAFGQLRIADRFIAQACGSAASNADVAKTLFEMLLPNRLKQAAPDQRDIVLLLDEASARFPWELLEDRWSRNGLPPAVAAGMVRQLKTVEFRGEPMHSFENTAYVVGNPDLDDWDRFVDLPGARREAERVHQLLAQAGYDTRDAIDAGASEIVDGLHAKAWRVLHLAGHGEHGFELTDDPPTPGAGATTTPVVAPVELPDGRLALPVLQKKTLSGMVIGRNTFLTPGDVAQMRHVPELVFVNCCHLGNTGGGAAQFNKLAANLGVEFIRMGVRAVVCAGWAVDDAAALTFAETFYRTLLRGANFGLAVRQARVETHTQHPSANTWGAYQCYGDPGYRLVRADTSIDRPPPEEFYAPSELIAELCNLTEDTRMRSQQERSDDAAIATELLTRIDALLARVPESARGGAGGGWKDRADVSAALGFAYGEGRLFAEAVDALDRALKADRGDCPVRAAEQHANFDVRLAAQEWATLRAAGAGGDVAALQAQREALAERIERALVELDFINRRAPTGERLKLMGSACKRLAWVLDGRPRVEALLNMAQYYREALDRAKGEDAYAFTNWAVACLLLERLDPAYGRGNWHGPLDDLCVRQSATTRQALDDNPSLWLATGLADLTLVQLLLAAGDRARCEALGKTAAGLYADAFARGASPREIASVQEHLDFLVELVGDAAAATPWPAAVRSALEAVRRAM